MLTDGTGFREKDIQEVIEHCINLKKLKIKIQEI
jgi:hypothetical protein